MLRKSNKKSPKTTYTVYRPHIFSDEVALHTPVAPAESEKQAKYASRFIRIIVVVAFCVVTWASAIHSSRAASPPVHVPTTASITTVLAQNHTTELVGSYMEILPVGLAYGTGLSMQPASNCGNLQASGSLVHQRVKKFAYLYGDTAPIPGTPQCSLAQIVRQYGQPTTRLSLGGSRLRPARILLLYGQTHLTAKQQRHVVPLPPPPPPLPLTPPVPVPVVAAPVVPPLLDNLSDTSCSGQTIMNVVAHQDDDILFINPDITHDLQNGECVRTVYLTAGDDGRGSQYWRNRQRGAEAAYAVMLGSSANWHRQTVDLGDGNTITIANLVGSSRVSLIFFNLPDGNLDGSGFAATKNQSLAKLLAGSISTITSVDHQSSFGSGGLTAALDSLMNHYKPTQINTQSNDVGLPVADHSDHIATGQYGTAAAGLYSTQAGIVHYFMGYPIRGLDSNLSADDTASKAAAYFAYAAYDPEACNSMDACVNADSSYAQYLSRQYTQGN